MKHLVALCSIWMFLGLSYSQEDVLYNLRGTHYSESKQSMTSCNLEFRYNWKKDVLILIIHEDSSMYAGYLFTEEERDSINFMINKYLKWHKTAMDVDTEVDKAIHEIYLTGFFSDYNSKKKHSNGHTLFKTYFLSQDLGWHQLVLKFGTIEDRKNKSKRFKPKNIYLNKDQVLAFQKAFQKNYLTNFKKEKEKQKHIRKLFK